MNNVYFNDLFSIVNSNLLSAKKYVKIAVCWINFTMFKQTFMKLIDSDVAIDIILSETKQNHRHDQEINDLLSYAKFLGKENSLSIRYACLPKGVLMHEKMCIIDGEKVLVGSYNWSPNASYINCENLLVIDDDFVVDKFEFEFYELSGLDLHYYTVQRTQQRTGQIYVASVEQEDYYLSKVSFYKIDNGEFDYDPIDVLYPDISFYNTLVGIGDKYYEELYERQSMGEQVDFSEANARTEFELHKLITTSFPCSSKVPYVHAVGVIRHQLYHKNDEFVTFKILWKNRFIAHFIADEYDI